MGWIGSRCLRRGWVGTQLRIQGLQQVILTSLASGMEGVCREDIRKLHVILHTVRNISGDTPYGLPAHS